MGNNKSVIHFSGISFFVIILIVCSIIRKSLPGSNIKPDERKVHQTGANCLIKTYEDRCCGKNHIILMIWFPAMNSVYIFNPLMDFLSSFSFASDSNLEIKEESFFVLPEGEKFLINCINLGQLDWEWSRKRLDFKEGEPLMKVTWCWFEKNERIKKRCVLQETTSSRRPSTCRRMTQWS